MTVDQPKTGWPPGLLQDDSRELSRWLASRPGARRLVREALCQNAPGVEHWCAAPPSPGLPRGRSG